MNLLRSFFNKPLSSSRSHLDGIGGESGEAPSPRLIAGLGNPGRDNAHNRHNVGFWLVNRLARRYGIPLKTRTSLATIGEGRIEGRETILVKPRTYVNRSGEAVAALVRRHAVRPEEILIVCDSLDLPVGALRIRQKGGHGGHKGLRSIVSRLGTSDFLRIRIGIGRPLVDGEPSYDPAVIAEYVLSDPPPEERRALDEAVTRAVDAVTLMMSEGVEAAMNRFNR
jgi:PTH1 family peptidyl-tRNA hydrolase